MAAMQKIPTLFRRDPEDMRRVLPEVTPGCEWVLAGEGVATRKYDGTCVMLDDECRWWARREVKPGKPRPMGYRVVEADPATNKAVGWEPIDQSPFAKFHAEAVAAGDGFEPGTYELIGERINKNPEQITGHVLVKHGSWLTADTPRDFESVRALVMHPAFYFEGIVWHHPDGRMAKIKRRDFAYDLAPRPVAGL